MNITLRVFRVQQGNFNSGLIQVTRIQPRRAEGAEGCTHRSQYCKKELRSDEQNNEMVRIQISD